MSNFCAEKAAKNYRRRIGMRGRIFGYLLLFVLLLIGLLWLMQIAYLDKFYERIKTEQINNTCDQLAAYTSLDDPQSAVEDLAQNRQICLSIYRVNNPGLFAVSASIVASADVLTDCMIHHISTTDITRLYESTVLAGGEYVVRFSRTPFTATPREDEEKESAIPKNRATTAILGFWQGLSDGDGSGMPDSLILTRIVEDEQGTTYLLMLNSSVSPVTAVVSTLRLQLMLVSAILIVLALGISYIIARRLSAPIARINRAALRLGKGDFSGSFDNSGYREIGELADTLNFARLELAKSDQLQQEIIANISHDLRTPLTMIGGYAEFMRDFPDEDHSESVEVIISETQRLTEMVRDVLDDSRLHAGTEKLNAERFDLAAKLSELAANYNALSVRDGARIEYSGAEQGIYINGDEQLLLRAVGNLMNNALAHMGADKLILLTLHQEKERVRVEVIDHGPGVAPEDLPLIWQRYYHADAPGRSNGGSGLGLSIVRSVLELHNYKYGVESTLGSGSTFWFEAPTIKTKQSAINGGINKDK